MRTSDDGKRAAGAKKNIMPAGMPGAKKNIVLIGMPGAGKSTAGVVLAKRLGLDFVDSDLVIQERQGMLLHEIIAQKGLDGFLRIEEEINASLEVSGAVIATGGSVIYGKKAMEHLKRIGTVVYLQLPLAAITERLGDLNERGVAFRDGQSLRSLYEERVPLYEKYADIILPCEEKMLREIVVEIAEKISFSPHFIRPVNNL